MNNEEKILAILETMQTDMSGMQADMRDVKDRLTIIENDHGKSLAALHDGYKMLYEISKDIRHDVHKLNVRMERSESKIFALEFDKR